MSLRASSAFPYLREARRVDNGGIRKHGWEERQVRMVMGAMISTNPKGQHI